MDEKWQELDFVASANIRTYVQFYLDESGEMRKAGGDPVESLPRPTNKNITSEAAIQQVEDDYLARVRPSSNQDASQAIEDHFKWVNEGIRSVEAARLAAEPHAIWIAVLAFAERAYRRPLSQGERNDLRAYYQSLRKDTGLDHEDAMRDVVVSILMSPDFCYRLDLMDADTRQATSGAQALAAVKVAAHVTPAKNARALLSGLRAGEPTSRLFHLVEHAGHGIARARRRRRFALNRPCSSRRPAACSKTRAHAIWLSSSAATGSTSDASRKSTPSTASDFPPSITTCARRCSTNRFVSWWMSSRRNRPGRWIWIRHGEEAIPSLTRRWPDSLE